MSSKDDKRIQSIDSIETYVKKDLIRNKGEIKYDNILKQCKND